MSSPSIRIIDISLTIFFIFRKVVIIMDNEKNIQQSFNLASIFSFIQAGITFMIMLFGTLIFFGDSNVIIGIFFIALLMIAVQAGIGYFLRQMSKSSIDIMKENKNKILVSGILLLVTASLLSIIGGVFTFIGYMNLSRDS